MNFPARLKSILAEGLTGDTGHFLWQGDQLLDQAMTIRFDKQMVRRLVSNASTTTTLSSRTCSTPKTSSAAKGS